MTRVAPRVYAYNNMAGMVYLVGIGTGNSLDLTPRAEKAIASAEVVIGHGFSLHFARHLLKGKEITGQDMSPLERSAIAVSYCLKGMKAVIISTGDPGIYAIASTFFGYLKEHNISVPVEIVPGITTSSSAAARLGSPLGNDFAVISLADQAGSWPSTLERLKKAAALGFVMVLYNPLGKLGKERVLEASGVLESLLASQTTVGIVTGAGGEGESVQITSLGMLAQAELSRDSLIIIGNSSTYIYDTWMITPRAYQPGLGY
ncbi:MAG: precorrin-3B C(17)-methyltransferase [Dehalococcoidales bacterium]